MGYFHPFLSYFFWMELFTCVAFKGNEWKLPCFKRINLTWFGIYGWLALKRELFSLLN